MVSSTTICKKGSCFLLCPLNVIIWLELFILFTIALARDIAELKAENKDTQQRYEDLLEQQEKESAKHEKDAAEAQQRYEDLLVQQKEESAKHEKDTAEAQQRYEDLLVQQEKEHAKHEKDGEVLKAGAFIAILSH